MHGQRTFSDIRVINLLADCFNSSNQYLKHTQNRRKDATTNTLLKQKVVPSLLLPSLAQLSNQEYLLSFTADQPIIYQKTRIYIKVHSWNGDVQIYH